MRKPKEYLADSPGAIVQVDTAHVSLFFGFCFRHFTACDVFTRWQSWRRVAAPRLTPRPAFLDMIIARMPFPVRAIQVDGGSEFMAKYTSLTMLVG